MTDPAPADGPVPTQQPTTPEPLTPPPTPPAPAAPTASTPSAADLIGGLQQSLDGMTEGLITGMKEAFPVLSQAPQQPSQAQAQQVDQAQQQATPPADPPKEGRQPTRLARAWFGK